MKRPATLVSLALLMGLSGRASADDAVQKLADAASRVKAAIFMQQAPPEDALAQQLEQQYDPQFRQLYKIELHFIRTVCRPTRRQYDKISTEGEAALKAAVRACALKMRDMHQGRAMAVEQSDPWVPVAAGLAQAVRATLPPERAAQYQQELDLRAAARKRAVLDNLVAKIDKFLVLTTEQRDQLGEVLAANWKDSWNQTQMLMYNGPYLPQMPDAEVSRILTDAQRAVWGGIPKGVIHFALDLGVADGVFVEDEVWEADPPAAKAAAEGQAAPGPAAKK